MKFFKCLDKIVFSRSKSTYESVLDLYRCTQGAHSRADIISRWKLSAETLTVSKLYLIRHVGEPVGGDPIPKKGLLFRLAAQPPGCHIVGN
jgi:hypothetical protein